MAVLKRALILLAIGTIVGWFLNFEPVETYEDLEPTERRLVE